VDALRTFLSNVWLVPGMHQLALILNQIRIMILKHCPERSGRSILHPMDLLDE